MTRLRVTVKDLDVVAPEAQWKQNGALGLIVKTKVYKRYMVRKLTY